MIQNKIKYCMEVRPTLSSSYLNDIRFDSQKSKFKLREIARMQFEELQGTASMKDEETDDTPKSREMNKLTDTSNLWLDINGMSWVVERAAIEKGNAPTLKVETVSVCVLNCLC